jgi:O-antigen chain-terminating methyltransferase
MKERYEKARPKKTNRDGLLERVKGLIDQGKLYDTEIESQSVQKASGSWMPDYFDFYNEFRSPPEAVKKHQSRFVPYFRGCRHVLDIGSGRGEFLELLKENNIGGEGVDNDQKMIEVCRSKGLSVRDADAVTYLSMLDDGVLDGIFTDDLVEHLQPEYLFHMLNLCAKKLEKGRHMVIVTVNPLSWVTFSNIFFVDLTHKKPIHPDAMRFILTSAGFESVEIEFVSMMPEQEKLKQMLITRSMDEDQKMLVETYNSNIEKLNEVLFGPEDYVAIAKK